MSPTLTKIVQALASAGATPAQLKLAALNIPMNDFAVSLNGLRTAKLNLLLGRGVRLTTQQQAMVIRLIAQMVRLLPADLYAIIAWPPPDGAITPSGASKVGTITWG